MTNLAIFGRDTKSGQGGWVGQKTLVCCVVAVLSALVYFGTGGQNQGIVRYGLVGYGDVGWYICLVGFCTTQCCVSTPTRAGHCGHTSLLPSWLLPQSEITLF